MLNLLLDAAAENGTNPATQPENPWVQWVIFGVLIVLLVVWFIWSSNRNKKKQQEAQDLVNAVKPGNKVKTIGGICGIVVEVDNEENTFVLETGSEVSGKSYMKFDKQAIYQTDAVVEKAENKEEKAEEQPAEENKTEE
ncbi:MAG: preprotein translocase subunit YajC [Clostridia bacterium]|nr:preprotein translocase subunit YajC [Clostridia bacterium]